jgi:hypothetical protein|tara:strand:- start:650 stop:826 length:177 start_codon:yes stop_codon:yes gene_type:complete
MSKIDQPVLPQSYENRVDPDQFNKLVEALDQVIKALNSTYTPEQLREEQERFAFFIGQ